MPERTALVTGGAGGLGRSVVDALLGAGCRVVAEWGKLVPPARIALVVAFLCGEDSAAINGATVPV